MAAPLLRPDTRITPQPPLLCLLRLAALGCRTAPRGSVAACQALDPLADADDIAMVLARTLPSVMVRRPILWRPGTEGRSFDEEWLMALMQAIYRHDRDSERFLMARRVHPQGRALLRGLLDQLGTRLRKTEISFDSAERSLHPKRSPS